MDGISYVVQLFTNFMSNDDNNIRLQADNEIQGFIKNDPNSFAQLMFTILENHENFKLEIVLLCFIFLRNILYRATNAFKTNDPSLSYRLIPPELADSLIPIVLFFFTSDNPHILHNASYLLSKIGIYLLTIDINNPIIISLIQQIDNGELIYPSLKSILYDDTLETYLALANSNVFAKSI